MDAVKHLNRGDDPNEAWCSCGRLDDNVEHLVEATCTTCIGIRGGGTTLAHQEIEALLRGLAVCSFNPCSSSDYCDTHR